MSARMNPSRQLALGALIVSTLTLLAYYTLFLTESSLFGDKEQITITFDEARGLRAGDAVLVAGVRWGRVADVEYDSDAEIDRRITVKATLTQPVELREDGWFRIEDSTLLGGRVLSINPGTPGAATLPKDTSYHGEVVTSPLDAMGEFLSANTEKFNTTFDHLSQIVEDANAGKGVVGKLLKDDDMAADLKSTMDHIEKISGTFRAGEGTLGKLLMAEEFYDSIMRSANDLEGIMANVHSTTGDLEAGKGTIGALLKDEDAARDVKETIAHIEEVTRRLEAGEGLIGKLLTDESIFPDLQSIIDDIDEITAKVSAGEGTLGRILMKDDLHVEIERALGLITRSLEEYREAAPVTTMTSVLFSAF